MSVSQKELWNMLVCPKTHTRLSVCNNDSELVSVAARLAYPIRYGIPILIAEEARSIDDFLPQYNQAQSQRRSDP